MIFYLVPAATNAAEYLAPTQEAARAECRERGLRFNAEQMQHDVPTDKAGLQEYVNDLLLRADRAGKREPLVTEETPGAASAAIDDLARKAAARQRAERAIVRHEATSIVEFLLDGATVAEVESIMAAVGTRFAELVKEVRS